MWVWADAGRADGMPEHQDLGKGEAGLGDTHLKIGGLQAGEHRVEVGDVLLERRAVDGDIIDVHRYASRLQVAHDLVHNALEDGPGRFHPQRQYLPLEQAVWGRESRDGLGLGVQDQLVIPLREVQGGEHRGAGHCFQLLIDSVHRICVVHDVPVHHSEIDADAELAVWFWDAHHRGGVWAIALLDHIGLFHLCYLGSDGGHGRWQSAGHISLIRLPCESLDPVGGSGPSYVKFVDRETAPPLPQEGAQRRLGRGVRQQGALEVDKWKTGVGRRDGFIRGGRGLHSAGPGANVLALLDGDGVRCSVEQGPLGEGTFGATWGENSDVVSEEAWERREQDTAVGALIKSGQAQL